MVEILGNNLKMFMNSMEKNCEDTANTYTGNRYEVWQVSDDLFQKMCNMSEEKFTEIAGEDAWWRQSFGSVAGDPDSTAIINGKTLEKCWSREENYDDEDEYESEVKEYKSLSEYLCENMGASQPRNVCALAMDLAKYNGMTIGELFTRYEG